MLPEFQVTTAFSAIRWVTSGGGDSLSPLVWTVVQFWLRGAIIGEGFFQPVGWRGDYRWSFFMPRVGDSNALKQKGTAI